MPSFVLISPKEILLSVKSQDGNYFLLALEKTCHFTLAPSGSEMSLCGSELFLCTGPLLFPAIFSIRNLENKVISVLFF